MILSTRDSARRVLQLLNLELIRDREQVARVVSSGPAAEHHASAILPAASSVTAPAAGPIFSAGGHPLNAFRAETQQQPAPAACAASPAGSFSNS